MWNKPSKDGEKKYEVIHKELETQHLRLGRGYTKVMKFGNDEKRAKEVLTHFAEISAKEQLRLADELKCVGSSLSGMRKTSAGKAIMKGANGPPCIIL
jgi:hypothetical protein